MLRVNGSGYGQACIEAPIVARHRGRVHIVDRIPECSRAQLLSSLRNDAESYRTDWTS